MFIKIFLNEKTGAGAYESSDELRCAWQGEIEGDNDKTILNRAFEIFNINHPDDYHDRSLSVGDVVAILEDGSDARCYAVASVGFTPVELTPFVVASVPTTGGEDDEEVDPLWGADETPDYPMYEG